MKTGAAADDHELIFSGDTGADIDKLPLVVVLLDCACSALLSVTKPVRCCCCNLPDDLLHDSVCSFILLAILHNDGSVAVFVVCDAVDTRANPVRHDGGKLRVDLVWDEGSV